MGLGQTVYSVEGEEEEEEEEEEKKRKGMLKQDYFYFMNAMKMTVYKINEFWYYIF
jgi:nucleosome binding factor SPN SPT16 subunit